MVVMGNARIHHATKSLTTQGLATITGTAKSPGFDLLFLPPYYPELALVEMVFSTMQKFVAAQVPRTEHQLREAIGAYIGTMKTAKTSKLFLHAFGRK